MPAKKSTSTHQRNLYKQYEAEGRQHKNRIKRLEAQVRHNPNDEQAKAALTRLKGMSPKDAYRRNKFKLLGCKGKDGKTLLNVKAERERAWARQLFQVHQTLMQSLFNRHDLTFNEKYSSAVLDRANKGIKVKGYKKAKKVIGELVNAK